MKYYIRFLGLAMIMAAMAFTSCDTAKKDDDSRLLSLLVFSSNGLAVGKYYQGGIIAYILQPGDPGFVEGEIHGLIAATRDDGNYQWKTSLTSTSGTLKTFGTGYENTYTYMTGAQHPAAEVVRNATHGGYNDWYLPSRDEILKVYANKDAIGGFDETTFYWSSSEDTVSNASLNWYSTGSNKDNFYRVRAVRSF